MIVQCYNINMHMTTIYMYTYYKLLHTRLVVSQSLALTILTKSGFSEAPPTRNPSMSG